MEWRGKKKSAPIAFVGKGVCFDSGGLSLKPGSGMMGMKGDMGGAAAVTGAMLALATRKAQGQCGGRDRAGREYAGRRRHPSRRCARNRLSGQTIEVLNTDAEGRLVLADALTYTQRRFKPKFIIDLATLTGAIVQALGFEHAGVFSNDDKLARTAERRGPLYRRAGVAAAA